MMSTGSDGMTTNVSVMTISILSTAPPTKPEIRPTSTPTTVPMAATMKPMVSELWMASISSQKMSWPWEVVPSQCSAEGARFFMRMLFGNGSVCGMK